jgi:predicted nuclease of predicted toxin-antitoxin system
VKLLFDENLSPALVQRLANLFPESSHVHDCSLGAALDEEIWRYAARQGFVIVSKHLDFHDRSLLLGGPPKLIWLRVGNCSTASVENLLRDYSAEMFAFESRPNETVLILP